MSELLILCHVEHLAPYDDGTKRAYGLNLAVATSATTTPVGEKAKLVLRPWLAKLITHVSVFVKDNTPAVAVVPFLPQTWNDTPITFDAPQFAKRDLIIAQLRAEFEKCDANCLAWELPGDNPPAVVAHQGKPWHTFMGQTAQLPTPIPQLLNLSLIFYFDNPGNKPIVAAPILDFPDPTAFKLTPREDVTDLPALPARTTVKLWEYAPVDGLPAVKAYVEECPVRTPATAGPFLDLQTLWVKNPNGVNNFSEDWRALLETRMADAFDLSQRIVEHLKKTPAGGNSAQYLSKLRRMFLASLRDLAGLGVNRGPDNQMLLEFLTGNTLSPAQADEIRVAASALFKDVDAWAKFVVETFPALSKMSALTAPEAITSIQDAAAELEELHQTILGEENLPTLAKAQWRRLSETPSMNAHVKVTLQKALVSPKLADVNLRRALALENLGVFWRRFVVSGLTDASDGKLKVTDNFSCYFRAYAYLRFGETDLSPLAAKCGNLNDLRTDYEGLKVSPPYLLRGDAVLGELDKTVELWSVQSFGDKLVPPPLQTGAGQTATEEFTEVPHAVTIMVDKLDADAGSADLLSSIAGVGVLMREEGAPKWQCLNMADARLRKEEVVIVNGQPVKEVYILEHGEPLFERPVLVASRLNYINDLRQSFVTYNNHPLAAKSPAAMLTKRDPDSKQEPEPFEPARPEEPWETLVSYFYAKPRLHAEARIPALKFGRAYEVLPFLVGNSGIVPRALAKKTGASETAVTTAPGQIDLDKFDSSRREISDKIRKFTYYRKVRVGHIRVSTAGRAAGPPVEETCLNLPPIPETVHPRLRDLKLGEANAFAGNASREKPLLLLSPFAAPNALQNFSFYMRLPSTDINTWDRWVAGGKIYNQPLTSQALKDLRTTVWREHYRRVNAQPDSEECRVVPAASNPAIDEPAVALMFYAELEKFDDAGGWQPAKTPVEIGLTIDVADPQPLVGVQAKPVLVNCKVADAAATDETFEFKDGGLQVALLKGRIYRLRVSCCLPKGDYPKSTGEPATARFARIYRADLAEVPKKEFYKISPFEMFIEVATDELVPGAKDAAAAQALLQEWLIPSFVRSAVEDAVEVRFKKRAAGLMSPLVEQTFPFVQRVELKRQMWRWQGRDTRPHPATLHAAEPPPTEVERWEAREYGHRFDDDHVLINMDSKVNDDPGIDPQTAAGRRLFSYVEYLTGPKCKKEELRAVHYRFKATVYSRYAGILPPDKASSVSTTAWKSKFVPCRLPGLGDPPKVKLIFPLTQSFGASTAGTAGLLAVFDEPWHEIGGIGEGLGIEVARVADPEAVPGATPETFYYEIGLDPVVSGRSFMPTAVSFAEEQKRGPVGHTFDRSDDEPFFTATSFIVPAPNAPTAGASEQFGPWGMCKISFRRIVLVGKGVRLESKFTDPFWVQYLPEFSLFREMLDAAETDLKNFSDLRLEVTPTVRLVRKGNAGKAVVLKSKDGGGKNLFERYLILTREVFDATGRADQEVYLGVLSQKPLAAGEWQTKDNLNLAALPAGSKLRARIVEVQRRDDGQPAFTTAAELWRRLFDPSAADHERCRVVRISEPIYSENAVKKECD